MGTGERLRIVLGFVVKSSICYQIERTLATFPNRFFVSQVYPWEISRLTQKKHLIVLYKNHKIFRAVDSYQKIIACSNQSALKFSLMNSVLLII